MEKIEVGEKESFLWWWFMVVYFNYPNQPGLHNQNTSSDSIRSNYMIFKWLIWYNREYLATPAGPPLSL